jgi:hypothetical protein
MQLRHAAEVETVDGKCDRKGEQAWTQKQRPEKQSPVLLEGDLDFLGLRMLLPLRPMLSPCI